MKMSVLAMLVGVVHGLIIRLLNSFPNLGMKFLNLLSSLLDLPTNLNWIRDWNKVQSSLRVSSIHHLERKKVSGLASCSIEGKFDMRKQLIPTLTTVLN